MTNTSVAASSEMARVEVERRASSGALASLALSVLLPSLATSSANVALPTLTRAFGASFPQVQWVVLAYLLTVTTLVVSAGRLGDLIGRRRLLLAGVAVFTGASLLGGAAPGLWTLIAARAAQGLGAAAMLGLAMAFVGEAVPRARAGSAMGLLGAMSAIGTTLGPSLGGLLIAELGWRAVLLVNAPLGGLTLLLAWRHLPPDRPAAGDGAVAFDVPGALLLGLTLAALALATTAGDGRGAALDGTLLGVAAAGLGLFVLVEARAPSPLISPSVLRERARWGGLVTSAVVSTVMMTTLIVGPFHLSRALGLGVAEVGAVMSVGPLVAAVASLPAGRLVDRLGVRRTSLAGLAGLAAGTLVLAATPPTLGVGGYVAPIVLATCGYALFQTANNTGVMADVRPDERGVVSGALNLSRNVGLLAGASVMGSVFALATGAVDVATAAAEAVAGGTRTTFGVATALVALALTVSALSGARRSSPALQPL
ncbi:MAG: MFS transporter [Planctomycetota bacterium]|nr:MFS transporter [Planctomycetota bacterium]